MAQAPLSPEFAQAAIDALTAAGGNLSAAARALNISRPTLENRVRVAQQRGLKAASSTSKIVQTEAPLKQEIRLLRAELAKREGEEVTAETIRRKIVGLKDSTINAAPPEFLLSELAPASGPGVPTLFLSDLHWGEVVKSGQIMGKNSYNLAIAHKRMRSTIESADHLLRILDPKKRYPGIVLALGGDMISGNIHEELQATNEINTMPTVLDLYGVLRDVITYFADRYGKVFVPCVTGNHGRDTHKIWNKDRHHTSFDWLLYCFLAKHFENDNRVTFQIPDGPDALYRVYGHRYLLTHGDQFRGGDGVIGALGPIIRGDHRKRSRNAQVDLDYDTMLLGHWHQYMHLTRLIVNGSLKGYDEYAFNNNFPFERPQQALWVTHPTWGLTYRMPVLAERGPQKIATDWVSVPK